MLTKLKIYTARLIVSLSLLISTFTFAAETYSDHEQFCQSRTFEKCDFYLKNTLARIKPYSNQWYKISSYQLDFYYDHQLFSETLKITSPLLEKPELPSVFKAQIYFYHAKALNYTGQKLQAKEVAFKTKEILKDHFDAFQDPYRIVEIANLYHVFGDPENALKLLQKTQHQFAKRQDPHFNFELYGNLAQTYIALGDLDKQVLAWQNALYAANQTNDPQKIKIAYGGLAFSQKANKDFQGAYNNYLKALSIKAPKQNQASFARLQINLAEMGLALKNKKLAADHFKKILPQSVPRLHKERYLQLQTKLQIE
ncbi:tetratricopeptide repeat protein [Pseudoalteromonas sp. SSM20]|uniref:tetratricopeptide repeat protein n=1 Tax=Pseudoalteromonas sp. SSM20 TaxID=3139394 RepID=UPI003BA9ADDF